MVISSTGGASFSASGRKRSVHELPGCIGDPPDRGTGAVALRGKLRRPHCTFCLSFTAVALVGYRANLYVRLIQQYVGVDQRRSDLAGSLPVPDRDIDLNVADLERARSD